MEEAANMECEGVIFRNITDEGPYSRGGVGESGVFVAMRSNQIKFTSNVGTFDARTNVGMLRKG